MSADGETLDFNSTKTKASAFAKAFNDVVDASLTAKRKNAERRTYVGASAIGGECERAIQFEFAGAPRESEPKPETLKKFDLGHVGEELARAWFNDAGFDLIQNSRRNGERFRFVQLDGRFSGEPDGVLAAGPDLPGLTYPAMWEHKSTGAKTHRELVRGGLKKARPLYWRQVHINMAYLQLPQTVFTCLNLDSGEIYPELIDLDGEVAQEMSDRAVRIVTATDAGELLPRPFADATDFRCRMCAFTERCWGMAS